MSKTQKDSIKKNIDTSLASDIFDALSKEKRLKIFLLLVQNANSGITPTNIANIMDMPKNTLSFHLNALLGANLIYCERFGKELFYKPNCELIVEVANFLLNDCSTCKVGF